MWGFLICNLAITYNELSILSYLEVANGKISQTITDVYL